MVQLSLLLSCFTLVSIVSSAYLPPNPDNRLVARDNVTQEVHDLDAFGLRIYSNNVRYAAPAKNRFPHELPWDDRKVGVINAIKSHLQPFPTLIGLQECLFQQLVDVKYGLNGNNDSYPWTHFGVGRDDGVEAGEYSPVIYNSEDWDLINGTYKWLSQTPDVPSKYPGADTKRIITMTTLKNKKSGKTVNYFNTHLDQASSEARSFSADLILNWIDEIPNNSPTFLSGDLNSVSNDTAYQTFAKSLRDTEQIARIHVNDDLQSYSGFEPDDHQSTIDFIWAPWDSNDNGYPVQVLEHEVIDNLFNGSYHFSDHRPVTAIIALE